MVTVFALFAGYPLAFLHWLLLYGKLPWLQFLLLCRLSPGVPPPVVAIQKVSMVTVFVALFAGYPLGFLHQLLLHRKSPWLQCLLLCLQVIPWRSSTSCCYTESHHGYSVCCSVCRLSPGIPPPVVAIWEITMVIAFVALFAGFPLAFLHQLLLYGKSPWLQRLLFGLQVTLGHSSTGCCYTGSLHGYSICFSVFRLPSGIPPPVVAIREITMVTVFVALFAGYPLVFLHWLLIYGKSPWLQCLLCRLSPGIPSLVVAIQEVSMVTVFVVLFAGYPLAILHQLCYTEILHSYSVCCSVCRLSPGVPPSVVAIREMTMVTVFVVLFAGYPLAFLHRLLLYGKSPWLQHLYFTLCGIAICYFNFGESSPHYLEPFVYNHPAGRSPLGLSSLRHVH